MTDTRLDVVEAKRRESRKLGIVKAVEFGLDGAVGSQGGQLVGFSVRFIEGDMLMTLRVSFEGHPMIGFVGAYDLGSLFVKAVREINAGKVTWRADRYRT